MRARDARERPGITVLPLLRAGEEGERAVAARPVEVQHVVEPAQAELVGVERIRIAGTDAGALLMVDLDHHAELQRRWRPRDSTSKMSSNDRSKISLQSTLSVRRVDQVDVEPHPRPPEPEPALHDVAHPEPRRDLAGREPAAARGPTVEA